MIDLLISFEFFKDKLLVWINQNELQIKLDFPSEEGLNFINWLLEEDEESWPNIGLPLPGSKYVDYFRPEDKKLASTTFGFHSGKTTVFKYFDIEYDTKVIEITEDKIELSFMNRSVDEWIMAANKALKHKSDYNCSVEITSELKS